jgi:hypothetical protein
VISISKAWIEITRFMRWVHHRVHDLEIRAAGITDLRALISFGHTNMMYTEAINSGFFK